MFFGFCERRRQAYIDNSYLPSSPPLLALTISSANGLRSSTSGFDRQAPLFPLPSPCYFNHRTMSSCEMVPVGNFLPPIRAGTHRLGDSALFCGFLAAVDPQGSYAYLETSEERLRIQRRLIAISPFSFLRPPSSLFFTGSSVVNTPLPAPLPPGPPLFRQVYRSPNRSPFSLSLNFQSGHLKAPWREFFPFWLTARFFLPSGSPPPLSENHATILLFSPLLSWFHRPSLDSYRPRPSGARLSPSSVRPHRKFVFRPSPYEFIPVLFHCDDAPAHLQFFCTALTVCYSVEFSASSRDPP